MRLLPLHSMFIITVCSSLHSFAAQSFQKQPAEWRWKLSKLSCMTWLCVPHSSLCNQHHCPHLILCEEHPPHPRQTTSAPSRRWRNCPLMMNSSVWWFVLGVWHLLKEWFNSSLHLSSETTASVYWSDPTEPSSLYWWRPLFTDWSVKCCFSRVFCGWLRVVSHIKQISWLCHKPVMTPITALLNLPF